SGRNHEACRIGPAKFLRSLRIEHCSNPGDQVAQETVVAFLETGNRYCVHFLLQDACPINVQPRVQSKLTDKLALRSAIALAEGMNRIEFAQVVAGSCAEMLG